MSGSVVVLWVQATLIIFGLLLLISIWLAVCVVAFRAVVRSLSGRKRGRHGTYDVIITGTNPMRPDTGQTVQFPYSEGEEGWPGER